MIPKKKRKNSATHIPHMKRIFFSIFSKKCTYLSTQVYIKFLGHRTPDYEMISLNGTFKCQSLLSCRNNQFKHATLLNLLFNEKKERRVEKSCQSTSKIVGKQSPKDINPCTVTCENPLGRKCRIK